MSTYFECRFKLLMLLCYVWLPYGFPVFHALLNVFVIEVPEEEREMKTAQISYKHRIDKTTHRCSSEADHLLTLPFQLHSHADL